MEEAGRAYPRHLLFQLRLILVRPWKPMSSFLGWSRRSRDGGLREFQVSFQFHESLNEEEGAQGQIGHPMLVELKNGETYNGHLVNCDTWMNIHLREVICTSKDGDRFWRMPECYIRGNTIKYLRVPDEVIDKVQEETKSRTDRKPPGVGRGRGRGREDNVAGRQGRGVGRGMDDGAAKGRGKGGPGGKPGGKVGGRGRG